MCAAGEGTGEEGDEEEGRSRGEGVAENGGEEGFGALLENEGGLASAPQVNTSEKTNGVAGEEGKADGGVHEERREDMPREEAPLWRTEGSAKKRKLFKLLLTPSLRSSALTKPGVTDLPCSSAMA